MLQADEVTAKLLIHRQCVLVVYINTTPLVAAKVPTLCIAVILSASLCPASYSSLAAADTQSNYDHGILTVPLLEYKSN